MGCPLARRCVGKTFASFNQIQPTKLFSRRTLEREPDIAATSRVRHTPTVRIVMQRELCAVRAHAPPLPHGRTYAHRPRRASRQRIPHATPWLACESGTLEGRRRVAGDREGKPCHGRAAALGRHLASPRLGRLEVLAHSVRLCLSQPLRLVQGRGGGGRRWPKAQTQGVSVRRRRAERLSPW